MVHRRNVRVSSISKAGQLSEVRQLSEVLCPGSPNPTNGSWWMPSDPFYKGLLEEALESHQRKLVDCSDCRSPVPERTKHAELHVFKHKRDSV